MNLDESADRQTEILRAMTPAQRARTGILLWHTVRRWKLALLRQEHPELTESQIQRLLRDAILYARD
jgi:hypothetical protein